MINDRISINENNIIRIEIKEENQDYLNRTIKTIQYLINHFDYKESMLWHIFDSSTDIFTHSSFFDSTFPYRLVIGVKLDEVQDLKMENRQIFEVIAERIFRPLKIRENHTNYITFSILHEFGHFLDYRSGNNIHAETINRDNYPTERSFAMAYRKTRAEKIADDFAIKTFPKLREVL